MSLRNRHTTSAADGSILWGGERARGGRLIRQAGRRERRRHAAGAGPGLRRLLRRRGRANFASSSSAGRRESGWACGRPSAGGERTGGDGSLRRRPALPALEGSLCCPSSPRVSVCQCEGNNCEGVARFCENPVELSVGRHRDRPEGGQAVRRGSGRGGILGRRGERAAVLLLGLRVNGRLGEAMRAGAEGSVVL